MANNIRKFGIYDKSLDKFIFTSTKLWIVEEMFDSYKNNTKRYEIKGA